jgi:hypothetical protein
MSIDVGLMLAQALPQIVGGANVEMTGYSNGFENVNVVHRWVSLVRLRTAGAALRRDAFALWVGRVFRSGQKRGQPRCSPRGTRGRKRVKGIEPSFSNAPGRKIRSTRDKDGCKQPKTKTYVCENVCDFYPLFQ